MAVDQSLANALFGALIVLCGLLLLMEVRHPYNKVAAKVLRQSHATNTSAFLFNNVIMSILSVSSLLVVAAEYSQYGLLGGFPDGVVKWVVSFVLMDFSVYAWHYVGHHSEFLWRFHKIHHSDKSFHVTTGLRFHVFDQLLEVVVECICVILIGVSAQVVIVCEVLRMAFVFFHHSNLSFPGEKWLSYIIITPYLHRAHHSTVREEHDSNYGIVLSVWDLMFETRKELIPNAVGLEMIEANDLVQLFCLAFVTERRLARLLHNLPRRRRRGSELPIEDNLTLRRVSPGLWATAISGLTSRTHLTAGDARVSTLRGNAGAGGAMLTLAAGRLREAGDGGRRRGAHEARSLTHSPDAVDPLAGRDHRGMPGHRDEFPVPACLDPQNAETVLLM
jgi:sterol desaturase/sphingolipid hydroxylase (fatty acid hydroxylase superfamily)